MMYGNRDLFRLWKLVVVAWVMVILMSQAGSALAAANQAAEVIGDEPRASVAIQPIDKVGIATAVKGIKETSPINNGTVELYDKLYDNGPLVNSPGTGAGGADESMLQDTSLGMSTYGFGHQFIIGNRIADDFKVTDGKWTVKKIHLFAYQTGSPINPSSITGVYLQIWDGPPNDPASKVVWGDLTTNRLVSSSWSGIYRVKEDTSGDISRPIMLNVVNVDTDLKRGTYWLDWMTDGSLASGPWIPPITIAGQATTGNALQFVSGTWNDASDSTFIQGMPFVLYGTHFSWILMNPPITSGGVH
ncbi:MAG: hypothetical protein NTY00_04560 [Deltaproteobacteria bacterium]|nr:hypothetical protein [Deltaproteobacteria bacterium]